ncbi:MAG TPA: lipase family protein [Candidatus Nanopelagicales bacterium]
MFLVEESVAPSLATLRPLRPEVTPGFPVYPDLVERLLASPDGADPAVMHALAVCAGYAYAGPDVVTMMMARMGLTGNRCRTIAMAVDPMFIRSTAHVVQSEDGRVVIVCYRGTEPMSLVNWLTDADVYPDRVRLPLPATDEEFTVHAGFYRNVRATRFEVLSALERAGAGASVTVDAAPVAHPMQLLLLAGHSLGGAMASLLAIMLRTNPHFAGLAQPMGVVATFGQPMVASPELAAACQADAFLASRVVRHVYIDDVVPHLPPRDSGPFAHVGVERRYDGQQWSMAEPTRQLGNLVGLLETPLSFLSRRIEVLRRVPFRHSIDDHLPHHYITALTPPGVPSEFGDLPYASSGT